MAIADYDPLFQPIRGKILGTVMQTGRNAPVIKSIDNNHGQQLRALQNSKAQLQHAAALWRELDPADQLIWDAKRPDFPTVDRYGNPVLSSAYSLFLRAIAHLPNDRQVFLTSPGSPFTGTLPPDAQVNNDAGSIKFTSMEAPVGQNFDVSVFCTRYNPVSKDFAKPSFRRVLRMDDYTGSHSIDITVFIEQEFGPIDPDSRMFWCVKTWKTGTPELVGDTCGFVDGSATPPHSPYLNYDISVISSMFQDDAGTIPVATSGDLVAYIDSITATSFPLIQTTPAYRPSYLSNGLNSLPCLSRVGAINALIGGLLSLSDWTVFSVAQIDVAPLSYTIGYPVGLRELTTADSGGIYYGGSARAGKSGLFRQLAPGVDLINELLVINDPVAVVAQSRTPGSPATRTRTHRLLSYKTTVNPMPLERLSLMRRNDNNWTHQGQLSQVLVYNSYLSDSQIQDVFDFLSAKWSLT